MLHDAPPTPFATTLLAPLQGNNTDPQTLLQLALQVLGMRTTFFARLTDQTMFVRGVEHAEGRADPCILAAGDTAPLSESYCQFVYRSGSPLLVPDARNTLPFANFATTRAINIGSYVGVPLIQQDGTMYGTLCGVDPAARTVSTDQIALLQMLGHALMAGLERVATLKQLEEQRAEATLALKDSLTGLPNRRAFDKAIEANVVAASVSGAPLTLIFADVDQFKHVNDTYGHAVGDLVLQLIAARMCRTLGKAEQVFRYGGEELVVLLAATSAEDGIRIAEQLRLAIAAPIAPGEVDLHQHLIVLPPQLTITASFGVATYPTFVAGASDLLHRADAAMYLAKQRGRNHVCWADPNQLPPTSTATPSEDSLEHALVQRPVVDALLIALAARDGMTSEHAERVTNLTELVARRLGRQDDDIQLAGLAARLHDVGKLGVSDAILNKPGPLNDAEWTEMRRHPIISMHILQECGGQLGKLANIVVAHHERWDGKGYPFGLQGTDIPLEARVIAVVDAYDAMTSDRPYRKALLPDQAAAELRRQAGTQFDPAVVEVFLDAIEDDFHAVKPDQANRFGIAA